MVIQLKRADLYTTDNSGLLVFAEYVKEYLNSTDCSQKSK